MTAVYIECETSIKINRCGRHGGLSFHLKMSSRDIEEAMDVFENDPTVYRCITLDQWVFLFPADEVDADEFFDHVSDSLVRELTPELTWVSVEDHR